MPLKAPKLKAKVYLKNYGRKIERYVNKILEQRLNNVSEQLVKELQKVLSKKGPSRPGEPPGITIRDSDERVPGGLMKSIRWAPNQKFKNPKLSRSIGSTLPRGFWLEVGVRGGKVIRPVRARALLVPVSSLIAHAMLEQKKHKGSGRGGFLGMVQKPTGQWYALRTYVIQGPIAPRPWLKPTFFKNLKRVGLTLGQKIY